MIYKGSCHCGKVAFEVEGELKEVVSCNCTICARRGSLLWAVSRDKLRVLTAEDGLTTYAFNKHAIKHRFCQTCGIHPFGEGDGWVAINIRCLDGVDLASIAVQPFDGRSM